MVQFRTVGLLISFASANPAIISDAASLLQLQSPARNNFQVEKDATDYMDDTKDEQAMPEATNKMLRFRIPEDLASTINLLDTGAFSGDELLKRLGGEMSFNVSVPGGLPKNYIWHAAQHETQLTVADCLCGDTDTAGRCWSHSEGATTCISNAFYCLGECPTSAKGVITSMMCTCQSGQTNVIVSLAASATEDHLERGKAHIKALKTAPGVSLMATDARTAAALNVSAVNLNFFWDHWH